MTGPEDELVDPYLRVAEEARAKQAELSRVEVEEQERARQEVAQADLAARERAERYAVALQQSAQAIRMEASQAAEALLQSGLSPMTIRSDDKSVRGWIMWRKWQGSYVDFNSVRVYGEREAGRSLGISSVYPEHVYGFILSAGGSILAYQDLPARMKIKIPADRVVAFRDATDEELAQGCPRGATELTRGFFGAPEAELNDRDPSSAASRWRKLLQELIVEAYRRARPEAERGSVEHENDVEGLKGLIIRAPNAQWIARRHGPVSFTRPVFGKPKPVYHDLEPAISLGPLKWEFEMRDASPSTMSVDSGLTAKGVIVCMKMPAFAFSSSLREPVLEPLQRVARSLGLIP
jgi:hypothetical protein